MKVRVQVTRDKPGYFQLWTSGTDVSPFTYKGQEPGWTGVNSLCCSSLEEFFLYAKEGVLAWFTLPTCSTSDHCDAVEKLLIPAEIRKCRGHTGRCWPRTIEIEIGSSMVEEEKAETLFLCDKASSRSAYCGDCVHGRPHARTSHEDRGCSVTPPILCASRPKVGRTVCAPVHDCGVHTVSTGVGDTEG